MPDDAPALPRDTLWDRARALRARVDWMMLFPVAAALAWGFGQSAVAMVLVVVLPAFLALQGRPAAAEPAAPKDARAPLSAIALRRRIDEVLAECDARGRSTAVLALRFDGPADDWAAETTEEAVERMIPRVAGALRGQDQVLRSGGAGLTVLLCPTKRTDLPVLMNIVERVRSAVAEPLSIDGRAVAVRVSIGVCSGSMAPDRTGAALLAAAGTALEAALRTPGDPVRFYNAELRDRAATDHRLASEVGAALEDGRIGAWFQPQIDSADGTVVGFEALARWDHPELGSLEPDRFLPAAAAAGRMGAVGAAVLGAALDALEGWDAEGVAVPRVCLNLSLQEMSDPQLPDRLAAQVDAHGIAPERIALELPQAVLGRAGDEAVAHAVGRLREAGFALDLDDFGTGAASVAQLAGFGVGRVALGRGVVAGIDADSGRRRVVAGLLALNGTLGIATLAEGVETEALRELLTDMGCPHLQGFAIARPMPYGDTLSWLRAHGRPEGGGLRSMRPHGTA